MSNPYINKVQNTFSQSPWFAMRGPVLCSQMYVEKYGQMMQVIEFEVANGTYISEEVIPAGMFVEIRNERNSNKARLVCVMAPLDEEGDPVFKTRCKLIKYPNQYICKAKECRTIIPKTDPPPELDSGTDIWESTLAEYDDNHYERITTTILEYSTSEDAVYDEVFKKHIPVTRVLTQTKANDAGYTAATPPALGSFISYEAVKCGWWLKTTERFNPGSLYTMCGVANYYWPNVLKSVPELAPVTGIDRDGQEYLQNILTFVDVKESYNGPCKASYAVSWATSLPVCPVPDQLITDTISYQGIMFNFSINDCLHMAITFTENTGSNHPTLKPGQARVKTFAATTPTDWPESVLADYDVKPYKGGYLITELTIYSP